MELFLFWFVGAIIVAIIASSRGRTVFGWFLLSVLFSPLLMGILVLCLGNPKTAAAQAVAAREAPNPDTHVRCPDCRELVRKDARKCKHCGTALVPQ